jgi:hypothetical protein
MCPKEKLIPGGILEPVTGRSYLFFGTSYKTSDFIVHGLLLWWKERQQDLCGLNSLSLMWITDQNAPNTVLNSCGG